jgi:hypothetical protein
MEIVQYLALLQSDWYRTKNIVDSSASTK